MIVVILMLHQFWYNQWCWLITGYLRNIQPDYITCLNKDDIRVTFWSLLQHILRCKAYPLNHVQDSWLDMLYCDWFCPYLGQWHDWHGSNPKGLLLDQWHDCHWNNPKWLYLGKWHDCHESKAKGLYLGQWHDCHESNPKGLYLGKWHDCHGSYHKGYFQSRHGDHSVQGKQLRRICVHEPRTFTTNDTISLWTQRKSKPMNIALHILQFPSLCISKNVQWQCHYFNIIKNYFQRHQEGTWNCI